MPAIRELLYRFRPAGAPGAAAGAAVPADRAAELAAELAPVFAALVPVTAEISAIRSAAADRADACRADAAAAAARMVAEAHRSVDEERADGYAKARDGVVDAAAAMMEEGRRTATEIDQRIRQQLPRYVDRAVASALVEAGAR